MKKSPINKERIAVFTMLWSVSARNMDAFLTLKYAADKSAIN